MFEPRCYVRSVFAGSVFVLLAHLGRFSPPSDADRSVFAYDPSADTSVQSSPITDVLSGYCNRRTNETSTSPSGSQRLRDRSEPDLALSLVDRPPTASRFLAFRSSVIVLIEHVLRRIDRSEPTRGGRSRFDTPLPGPSEYRAEIETMDAAISSRERVFAIVPIEPVRTLLPDETGTDPPFKKDWQHSHEVLLCSVSRWGTQTRSRAVSSDAAPVARLAPRNGDLMEHFGSSGPVAAGAVTMISTN